MLVMWEGEKLVVLKWKKDKDWETGRRPKIPFTCSTVLPRASPLHCIQLLRASDSNHRNSETSTNQSWFHFWRSNTQEPHKTFTTLPLVIMESGASHKLAALVSVASVCFIHWTFLLLSALLTGQVFLLPIFELAGCSEPRVQTVEQNSLCTVLHSFLFYKDYCLLRAGTIWALFQATSLLCSTILPTLPWSLSRSIPSGSVPWASAFLLQNLQHFLHFPKNLTPP